MGGEVGGESAKSQPLKVALYLRKVGLELKGSAWPPSVRPSLSSGLLQYRQLPTSVEALKQLPLSLH